MNGGERPESRPPLSGVRIVSVSQYGAGPYATQLLCDLGAEVIKIENPHEGGDVGRRVPPQFTDGESSLFFEAHNRGKKSLALNLATPEGRAILKRVAATSDVVFNNLRGDVGSKLGLTYADLKDCNPRLVCVSLSAYGTEGEEAKLPGYDYLFQARAGWMQLTGGPEVYPLKSGLSLVDMSAALVAALATASAVYQARETGVGGDVETSLYDTALSLLGYIGTWNMSQGWEPERLSHSAHPSVVPFQEFATRDGHLVVACVKDKFFRELCDVLDLADLARAYPTMAERQKHRETVTAALAAKLRQEDTGHWIPRLRGRVPCEPVNSLSEALAGGEVPASRGLLTTYVHPRLGEVKTMGAPIRGWWGSSVVERRAPFLGEHTGEVMAHIGMDEGQITQLSASGVLQLKEDIE